MLKCPKCGSEEFVTYKKVPVKVDKWGNVIDSTSDLSDFGILKRPDEYLRELFICANCRRIGDFGDFKYISSENFMKKTSILKK